LLIRGIDPIAVSNADKQIYLSTILYDYTDGKKPKTRSLLETFLNTDAQTNIPIDHLAYTVAKDLELTNDSGGYQELDFLIILGEDEGTKDRREIIRTLTPIKLLATWNQGKQRLKQGLTRPQRQYKMHLG